MASGSSQWLPFYKPEQRKWGTLREGEGKALRSGIRRSQRFNTGKGVDVDVLPIFSSLCRNLR